MAERLVRNVDNCLVESLRLRFVQGQTIRDSKRELSPDNLEAFAKGERYFKPNPRKSKFFGCLAKSFHNDCVELDMNNSDANLHKHPRSIQLDKKRGEEVSG